MVISTISVSSALIFVAVPLKCHGLRRYYLVPAALLVRDETLTRDNGRDLPLLPCGLRPNSGSEFYTSSYMDCSNCTVT